VGAGLGPAPQVWVHPALVHLQPLELPRRERRAQAGLSDRLEPAGRHASVHA
jgi:hypothetical protein